MHALNPGRVFAILDAESHSASVCDHAAWAALRMGHSLSMVHVLNLRLEKFAQDALTDGIDFPERAALRRQIEDAAEHYRALSLTYGDRWRAAAVRRAQMAGVLHCEASVHPGSLHQALAGIPSAAALVVAGLHHLRATPGDGAQDFAQELAIRTVKTSVLVCADGFRPPTEFMLGYDGLLTASNAVDSVARSALLAGARCHLVMVADPTAANAQRLAQAASALEAAGYTVVRTLLQGEPHVALQDYARAQGVGLTVMGAYRQPQGMHYAVNGTLANMLRTSAVSCLILN